jgi:hypothetical protein
LLESSGLEEGTARADLMLEFVERLVESYGRRTWALDVATRPADRHRALLEVYEALEFMLSRLSVLPPAAVEGLYKLSDSIRERVQRLSEDPEVKRPPVVGRVGRDEILCDAALVFDVVHQIRAEIRLAKVAFVVAVGRLLPKPLGSDRVLRLLRAGGPRHPDGVSYRLLSLVRTDDPQQFDEQALLSALRSGDLVRLRELKATEMLGEASWLISGSACLMAEARENSVWSEDPPSDEG